jgi:hypothetical protein
MVTSGVRETYLPGSLPYDRIDLKIDKSKYYQLANNSVLLLSGLGESGIVGANQDVYAQSQSAQISIESKVLKQMEWEIETQNPRLTKSTTFVTGALPTGTYGTAGTYSVADASIFRPFDQIINETTKEILLVISTDTTASPDTISAIPAWESTGTTGQTSFPLTRTNGTPQAKTNGDIITIIGNAAPEGSGAQPIIDTDPVADLQYMQIIRKEFGEVFEKGLVSQRGYMGIDDQKERCKADWLIDAETAVIRSKINKKAAVTSGEGTARSMQGMLACVSTYNQAASALVGGGNDWTIPKFDQLIDQLSPKNRSGKLVMLASGTAIRKYKELVSDKTEYEIMMGDKEFGFAPLVYKGALPLYIIKHPVFDTLGSESLIFDPALFQLVNLDGDGLDLETNKRDIPGTAINGRRVTQDAYIGSYSIEWYDEAGNSRVTGLSHSFTA